MSYPTLIAGIKKDVVWANAQRRKLDGVAIYGWHYKSGRPIQNVYAGHIDWYVDYSHGIRLMSKTARLDGVDVRSRRY